MFIGSKWWKNYWTLFLELKKNYVLLVTNDWNQASHFVHQSIETISPHFLRFVSQLSWWATDKLIKWDHILLESKTNLYFGGSSGNFGFLAVLTFVSDILKKIIVKIKQQKSDSSKYETSHLVILEYRIIGGFSWRFPMFI